MTITRRQLLNYSALAGLAALGSAGTLVPQERSSGVLRRSVVGGSWSSLGPEGGYVTGYAADTTNGRMFAGSDDSGGIYYSDDDGGSWTRADSPVDATGWDLTVSRFDSDVVYATDIYGRYPVMRSTDGGETWTDIVGSGLSGLARTVSCLAEVSATTIYVGTGEIGSQGDGAWQGVLSGGVWSWSRVGPASGSGTIAGARVHQMVAVGTDPNPVVFAAVFPEPAGTCEVYEAPGLYYVDGTGWHLVSFTGGIAGLPIMSLAVGFGGELLLGVARPNSTGDVAFRWDYSGNPDPITFQSGLDDSWTPTALAWSLIAGEQDSGKNVYYVSVVQKGVFRVVETTTNNFTWTECTGLPEAVGGGDPAPLTLGLGPDGHVFVGGFNNAGVYRTASATSTVFAAVNDGIRATEVTSIVARSDNNWLIATLLGNYNFFPGGLYNGIVVSKDDGATWNPPGTSGLGYTRLSLDALCVAVSPETQSRTLLGSFQRGIWLSTNGDAAMTFTRQTGGADPILADESVTAVAFLDDDHAVAAVVTHGERPDPTCEEPFPTTDDVYSLRYSTNGGASWTKSNLDGTTATKSFAGANFALGIGAGTPRIWVAGHNEETSTVNQRGLYYSDDGGATWTAATSSVKHAACLLPDGGDTTHCFAGGGDGTDDDLFFDVTVGGSTTSMHILPAGARPKTGEVSSLLFESGRFLAGLNGAERRVPAGTIGSKQGAVYEWDGVASTWSAVHNGLVNNQIRNQMAIVYTSAHSAYEVVAPTYGGGVIRLAAS